MFTRRWDEISSRDEISYDLKFWKIIISSEISNDHPLLHQTCWSKKVQIISTFLSMVWNHSGPFQVSNLTNVRMCINFFSITSSPIHVSMYLENSLKARVMVNESSNPTSNETLRMKWENRTSQYNLYILIWVNMRHSLTQAHISQFTTCMQKNVEAN